MLEKHLRKMLVLKNRGILVLSKKKLMLKG
jgi:hypothetical protein